MSRLLDAPSGGMLPIRPVSTLPVTQVSTALRKLQSGQTIGKIVVTMGRNFTVVAQTASPLESRTQLFNPDGIYLITGGTGGIGRASAAWMLENDARNIVLLGRSGSSNPEVARLLSRSESSKPAVCVRAHVEDGLVAISDLPPVRGVMHGSLFLQHLHDLLSRELDWFISLASIDGVIGHVGQAIYAGTLTFFDAFSHYRHSLGLPSVSIGLPVVEGIGYVADRQIGDSLKQSIGLTLSESHVYNAVKGAIIGASSGLNSNSRCLVATRHRVTGGGGALLPWQRFSLLAALRHSPFSGRKPRADNSAHHSLLTLLAKMDSSSDPAQTLLDTILDRIALMTMTDRDDVRSDRNSADAGLDSLGQRRAQELDTARAGCPTGVDIHRGGRQCASFDGKNPDANESAIDEQTMPRTF